MKKSLLLSLAFAALLMTGCRKSNVQPLGGGNGVGPFGDYEMTLSASNGDDDKSSIEGLKINYQLGDKLHVVDATNGYLGYLTATSVSGTSGTFKGFITKPGVGHNCMFYFVGTNNFGLDGDNYTFDVSEQYGGLSVYVGNVVNDDYENGGTWKGGIDDVSNGLQLMKSKAAVEVTQTMLDAHNFGSQAVQMRSMMAISRLNLQVNGTSMGGELSDSVTVSGAGCYSTGTLNIKTGALTPNAGNITLKKANNDYYMVLIPEDQTEAGSNLALTFTATSRNNESVSITKTVAANKFYNSGGAWAVNMVGVTPLYLPGDFTVASGKTVKFSKGNLYWDGSAFKMESNQWDATPTAVGADPSETYTWSSSHVSHFYWSKTASVAYAQGYSDGSASTSDVFFTNKPGDESEPNPSFTVEGETGTWRTLSQAEWNYLLGYDPDEGAQTDEYGRENANKLCKYVKLFVSESGSETVKGLVILPDDGDESLLENYNDSDCPMRPSVLSSNNAVFLPAAGYRYGTDVGDVGSDGYYWSSTPNEDYEGNAYSMGFYSGDVATDYYYRGCGYCVRLVR